MKQIRHHRGIVPTQSHPISATGTRGWLMSRIAGPLLRDDAASARMPAALASRSAPLQRAGPFDPAPAHERDPGFAGIVVTGLLVVYPALAIVAAVIVGLKLSGAGA
jgi:hypothetical protein